MSRLKMPDLHHISHIQTERINESARAQSLIDAGIELFGEYGINGTTTRMLSKQSGANSAAIPYYFGSKEGLYMASMTHVVNDIIDMTSPFVNKVEQCLNEGLSKEDALKEYQKMMEGFCALFIEENGLSRYTSLICREHVSPTEAYDIFYDRYYKRTQKIMCRLIGNIKNMDAHSDEVVIRAHAFFGQTLGFLTAREALTRSLKGKKITLKHHSIMKKIIEDNIDSALKEAMA